MSSEACGPDDMVDSCNEKLVSALLQLDETSGSGVVRLERGSMRKQLVVRRGLLAFAESSLPDEHLARVLVRLNLIPRAALTAVTTSIKAGSTTDQAIVAATGIRPETLKQGAREQALIIGASLLEWSDATVRFYPGEDLVRRGFDLGLSLSLLIVESARKAASQRKGPRTRESAMLAVPVDGSSSMVLRIPLNRQEAFAFSLVREPLPVEHLLELIPAEPGSGKHEVLDRLLLLGLVHLTAAEKQGSGTNDADLLQSAMDEMISRFEVANHYEILSLTPEAREDQIKAAYHDLARRYHPDRFQSAEFNQNLKRSAQKLFTYITAAYSTLISAPSRALYDEQRLKSESKVEAVLQARAAVDPEKEKMAETLFRAGQSALLRRDFDKAVTLLKECVWILPDVARFRRSLGAAQSELPPYRKDAEQNLLKAIELDRTVPEAYLLLGRLYLKVNLPRRAEVQFNEVLRWDPTNTEARYNLQELQSVAR